VLTHAVRDKESYHKDIHGKDKLFHDGWMVVVMTPSSSTALVLDSTALLYKRDIKIDVGGSTIIVSMCPLGEWALG
jgi:hypothetical protein